MKTDHMNTLSIFSVPLIICFFTIIIPVIYHKEYHVTADISINCGSKYNFAADCRCKKISSSTQTSASSVSADQAQYKTARISRSWFSYPGFKGFKDGLFTVKAGPSSNLDNILANPNPQQLAQDSPMLRFLKVCGDRNIIVTVAISMMFILVTFKLWQLWDDNFLIMDEEREKCRCFSLPEIEAATGNFNHEFVIGEGGFGKVYKGIIGNGKEAVAIKRLKYSSNQGAHEFSTEIKTLSKLRHANLVSLIGYCSEQQEMILVYEYMFHGTLRDHFCKKQATGNNRPSFDHSWNQCLDICIGSAQGLNYLHTVCKIIHRDVKTSNILLDENFVAKLSDFGLAKLENICEPQSHISTCVKGTPGYMDPYYKKSSKLTRASDVYAFGVVLLELLCGRPALDRRLQKDGHSLVTWARENISKGDAEKIVSPNLKGEILPDSLNAFVRVAESCLDEEPKRRPTMTRVVSQLEYALELQEKSYSLASAKPSNEMDSKELTSGQNGLPEERLDNILAEDYFAREVKLISELDGPTIEAATNGFSRSNVIGKGRYGTIYKVVLRTDHVVAVEKYKSSLPSFSFNEIYWLSENKHPNIMNLLVILKHEGEWIFAYEFMENRSLAAIYGRKHRPWSFFFKIIIGIARGINYLHNSPLLNRGIYSNIDPCNIYLDAGMNPKIAINSCGMMNKTSYYVPPEGYGAITTFASDIYSFAVLVLDMLSMGNLSKQDLDLVTYARGLWNEGKALELVGVSVDDRFSSEEAVTFIELALSCTQFDPQCRPSMYEVIQALERDPGLEMKVIRLSELALEGDPELEMNLIRPSDRTFRSARSRNDKRRMLMSWLDDGVVSGLVSAEFN